MQRKMDVGNYSFMTEEKRRPSKKAKFLCSCVGIALLTGLGVLLFWLVNGKTFKVRNGGHDPENVCSIQPDSEKFDCHPERPIREEECLMRGCCYSAASDLSVTDYDLINSSDLGVPSCYYPKNYAGYNVSSLTRTNDGITADLIRLNSSGFAYDIGYVHLDVTFINDFSLRITLKDPVNARFEPDVPVNVKKEKKQNELYKVEMGLDGLLTVLRKTDNTIVFKTKLSQLVYSDQFLQLSTYTSSTNLYGLGEQKEGLRRSFNWTRYTLFNQGDLPVPYRNLYGSHPFYLVLEPTGNANGVFLLNSNAIDYILQPAPAVTIRSIGGIFDFFILLGPTPADVVKQYTGIIGRPFMIPYWSLGFQICKYGYFTLNKTDEILQRNIDAGVPIDVQWHDIDFMRKHLDFTYDEDKFHGLPEWVNKLHDNGMHYIAMISPGVSNTEKPGTYPPYDEGIELDLFVKEFEGDSYIEAKVWNENFTVFPDFSNPLTPKYWAKQFERYHSELKFDGVWIDMNEPLNFLNGSSVGCPLSRFEDPPYLPGRPYPLGTLTICMTAMHNSTFHYNEHNLLAFREAHATYDAMKNIREQRRPFIISRASFSGQGVHSGHWSGDITSNWEDMRYTIPSMLAFNMYGMPMIGSDICGFRLNTTEDLCARWQALGAFYPLSRNHNDFDTIEQDPAAFGKDSPVLKSTKDNLYTRYYLLPYYYTLFHRSHVYGETVVRPLFFEFPQDKNVVNIDEEFLLGPAILIMPALYKDQLEITPYIPKGLWYDFYTGDKIKSEGQNINRKAELTYINIAVRSGYIIPLQIPGKTTNESRTHDFDVLIALNENKEANGQLFWDDGDSLDTFENGIYNEISFNAKDNSFTSTIIKSGYQFSMNLNEIKVYGVTKKPSKVTINKQPLPAGSFEIKKTYLSISAKGHDLLESLNVVWE